MVMPLPWDALKALFTGIPEAVKTIIEIVQMPIDRRIAKRKEFNTHFVVPLHEQMQLIHKDYTEQFARLLELLDQRTNPAEIVKLLESGRLIFLMTRKDTVARAKAIADAPPKYVKQREVETFTAYLDAIENYLEAGSPGDSVATWYTAFINAFRDRFENGEDLYAHYDSITSGAPPAKVVRDAVYSAVHVRLPERWGEYATAHHNLSRALLG